MMGVEGEEEGRGSCRWRGVNEGGTWLDVERMRASTGPMQFHPGSIIIFIYFFTLWTYSLKHTP